MDNMTVVGGNSTAGINLPHGIAVFGTDTDSVIIADMLNSRVIGLWNVGTVNENISVVATQVAPGYPLVLPYDVYVDVRNGNNLYVSNNGTNEVILYTNMQSVNPPPRVVAGSGHIGGPGLNHLNLPRGVYVDSNHNVIVVSTVDQRVMFWPPNATFGTVLAGLGNISNTSMGLNGPCGIGVDENDSWLYVADAGNNRIQRYSLTDPWPANGTTVAGGNGAGSGSHQLNYPTDVKVSKKTGAIYIADFNNNRIQRWQQGATEGVTIAGDPYGNLGSSATQLSHPSGLALNTNETYIYVTDRYNNRIQQFQLI
jgi:hypothetical protein